MEKYTLKCLECGAEYSDDHFRLKCDGSHGPSFLRTEYRNKNLTLREDLPGMFKFMDFLPVNRCLEVDGAPVTYKSGELGKRLGLENLYIIFNGYWPERNAVMKTASFKELEAPSVLARIPENHDSTIVVASAGNTGRAFAGVCSSNNIPLLLVIPEESMDEIWSVEPFNDCVKCITASGKSDYSDAITLANMIVKLDGFFPEGGAANVARREGMATTVLDAACVIGSIPDHYFQAVGSGTGGISAWESCCRLREDGRYGETVMKLHLAQNHPFTPLTEAWNNGLDVFPELDTEKAKREIAIIQAKVLSNRKPPYGVRGGVRDVLEESNGYMYSVTNEEMKESMDLFEELEGCDIHPAAGVALGALIQAKNMGRVSPEDVVALNVTGGGESRLKSDRKVHYLEPFATMTDIEINGPDAEMKTASLLKAV